MSCPSRRVCRLLNLERGASPSRRCSFDLDPAAVAAVRQHKPDVHLAKRRGARLTNQVNISYACQNSKMLNDLLKNESATPAPDLLVLEPRYEPTVW